MQKETDEYVICLSEIDYDILHAGGGQRGWYTALMIFIKERYHKQSFDVYYEDEIQPGQCIVYAPGKTFHICLYTTDTGEEIPGGHTIQ